ncbi:hypothetical protein IQ241_23975 [Romeria aff. gracilis LEGE 07310]|uniref:Iron-sulfur cluster biosynthesis family protein n=1 Tax=Vasconcelosia minhoensis LEGE 07310 TaxID=915328 RepID=A0A8J7ALT5_9CYAN|nr:hypothetical protein [Romeria gracilis]MBE9080308.1 hypothetical protein [Romeria aff. gracilis LEGE 07310]
MTLNHSVMQAVEALDYRVTVGDVAAQAGIELPIAQQGLLALAADTQAHMQVSEAGEIAYEFPRNFRGILRNKHWQIQLQETWEKVWQVLFYLIRLSFGVMLLLSIVLIFLTIMIIVVAASSAQQNQRDNRGRGGSFGGGMVFIPRIWFGPNIFWWLDFDYGRRRRQQRQQRLNQGEKLNFFEAIFSFLFGDGDPNADLEERRWSAIATTIRNNGGTTTAEQVAPYLDDVGEGWTQESEDYMLPTLTRFNGQPEVSPQGDLIYYFPELQVTAARQERRSVGAYLKELPHKFTAATSSQVMLSIGLGAANLIGAIVLGSLLQDQVLVAELGGLVAFVNSIYWLLLAYGVAFLAVPLVRYFWVQRQNRRIESRNQQRQDRAAALNQAGEAFQRKLAYAQQFASQTVIRAEDAIYTTETDLIDQSAQQAEIDAEWQRRLRQQES